MAAGDDADFLAAERGDSDYEEEQRAAAAAAKCRKRAGDMGYSELQKECKQRKLRATGKIGDLKQRVIDARAAEDCCHAAAASSFDPLATAATGTEDDGNAFTGTGGFDDLSEDQDDPASTLVSAPRERGTAVTW
jgi:hypothetical protein